MDMNKTDVIVVGSGPSGVSAAITLARAGKKVVLTERGDDSGDKNMFGGEIYTNQTLDIFPNFIEDAPIERSVTEQAFILLKDKDSLKFAYNNGENSIPNSYTVNRSKWDRWCVEEAKKAGVFYAPKTLVKEIILENGRAVGVKTELENYYSDIVIIADGVNSILLEKLGLRKEIKDSDVTVNVKEVYKLSEEKINDRFNIDEKSGFGAKILGGPLKNLFSIGFLFTNRETISLGVGISLDDLKKIKMKPYELLEKLKEHPAISCYIKDAKLIEYSAHMIPEGGYNSVPQLYSDGIMVAGDAAMLVNNVHFEGTNFAMLSGKLAAETAIEALNSSDFSKKKLSLYEKKLKDSIILKDLKLHKDSVSFVKKHINTITEIYSEIICDIFKTVTYSSSQPKSKVYRNLLFKILKSNVIFKSIPIFLFAIRKCLKK